MFLFSCLNIQYLPRADFAFFSESPAVGCIQQSFMHLVPQMRIRCEGPAALPSSSSEAPSPRNVAPTSSCDARIRHPAPARAQIYIPRIDIPKRYRKLAFLKRDRHVRTHAHPENRSPIQSLALKRSATMCNSGNAVHYRRERERVAWCTT